MNVAVNLLWIVPALVMILCAISFLKSDRDDRWLGYIFLLVAGFDVACAVFS